MPSAFIVRSGPLFGSFDNADFVVRAMRCFRLQEPFAAANDVVLSPTYAPDLVDICLDLLIDGERGVWHLVNQGAVSWADLAGMAARQAKVSSATLQSCTSEELGRRTELPRYRALTSERGVLLPTIEDALDRFTRQCANAWQSEPDSERRAA
jgi:dTDP-4-dehydrorhamnose reductase